MFATNRQGNLYKIDMDELSDKKGFSSHV